ncbi:MAG: hypothetical protein GY906_04040 [bacterium]|nr:hypothetical protein [bacterium]
MDTSRRKDIALIIGLLVPVLMIVFVAGAILLPRLFSNVDPPRHDFLYMVGNPDYGEERFLVEDGRLVREELEAEQHYAPPSPGYELRFYRHIVETNVSKQLTFEEASSLKLGSAPISPDGYTVVPGRRSEFFFPIFSTADYRVRYLQKETSTTKLNVATGSDPGYYYGFNFLGWVMDLE